MSKESSCSFKTKMKMAGALRNLMMTMPFEKITVSDITEECNIHRQTFYYHFQDRYELLDWFVGKELVEPFVNGINNENFFRRITELLNTMYENKRFYQSALKINGAELQDYITRRTKNEFLSIASIITGNEGESRYIISEFLGFGLLGVIFNWAREGMKKTPEEMTADIAVLTGAFKEFSLKKSNK